MLNTSSFCLSLKLQDYYLIFLKYFITLSTHLSDFCKKLIWTYIKFSYYLRLLFNKVTFSSELNNRINRACCTCFYVWECHHSCEIDKFRCKTHTILSFGTSFIVTLFNDLSDLTDTFHNIFQNINESVYST